MIILMIAALAAHATHARTHAASGKPETLHVKSIDLADADGTTLKLVDAKGVALEPVMVPIAICRHDHLGRLLPGSDVEVHVHTVRKADGKTVRTVEPTQFAPLCS